MKKITYSIVLLWSVLFCSCQKEDTLTTVPDGGVQLNFSGAQANLSAEELSNIVETFHVLIYDETGNFVRHDAHLGKGSEQIQIFVHSVLLFPTSNRI
mgnify:CR=1 FL=1